MRILLITNIVSPHQIPLARELCKLVGEENFLFAAMADIDQGRLKNGWLENYPESWIIHPNKYKEHQDSFDKFFKEAEVVICGERLIKEMQERVNNNKLCFYMSERWWKPRIGILRLCFPVFLKMFYEFRRLSENTNFHYLSIGPFAARDMALVTSMKGRVWQWGYFPEMPKSIKYIIEEPERDFPRVLWVGRMLKWKRLDLLIKALYRLKGDGIRFQVTLVGNGPECEKLKNIAGDLLGNDYCKFIDFIPSKDVTNLMKEHDVYVLPSNGYEGWGAVVNESMSVGCPVIASDKTGSGAALIEHGVNGFLFESDSENSLYIHLKDLLINKQLRKKMSISSQISINKHWTPAIAAERFVRLSKTLIEKQSSPIYLEGPISEM
jgi:glycosyltransferase involved in cell wall biosynthesis